MREELIREVGAPRAVTHGPQLDAPLEDGLKYPARLIDTFPWETDLGDAVVSVTGVNTTRKVWHEPVGVVGASCRGTSRSRSPSTSLGRLWPPVTPWYSSPRRTRRSTPRARPADRREHRHSGRCRQYRPCVGPLVGEELTLSPKVDMISFTGSTTVGKRIMEKGAATMKRLFLELGGKSATIVLEDADFNTACLIGIGPLMHAGQGCAAPTRMLLPRSRYDEGVAILKAIYENIPAGDPQDPGTLCGPVISAKQQSRILGYIKKGVDEGATMLVGSTEAPKQFDKGFWVNPTLFTDVDNSMTIAQEEIFGPVLVVIAYEDEDDAVGSPTTACTGWPAT